MILSVEDEDPTTKCSLRPDVTVSSIYRADRILWANYSFYFGMSLKLARNGFSAAAIVLRQRNDTGYTHL